MFSNGTRAKLSRHQTQKFKWALKELDLEGFEPPLDNQLLLLSCSDLKTLSWQNFQLSYWKDFWIFIGTKFKLSLMQKKKSCHQANFIDGFWEPAENISTACRPSLATSHMDITKSWVFFYIYIFLIIQPFILSLSSLVFFSVGFMPISLRSTGW